MGVFSWIRNRVKQSFLAGIADAVQELQADSNGEAKAVEVLRLTVTDDQPAIATDAEVEPAKASRRR